MQPRSWPRRARRRWRGAALLVMGLVTLGGGRATGQPQEGAMPPHWIWHPTGQPGSYPAERRYFRKSFLIKEPGSRLALDVTADNAFVLYLDGKEVARGDDWHTARSVEARLATGMHTLAAVATNEAPGPAGFLVRGGVLPLGQAVPIHTDRSWKTRDKVPPGDAWTRPDFDDSSWKRAADLGVLGTGPWTGLIFESADASERFKVPAGFRVKMVAAPSVTGSVVAFTFDPEGRPAVSSERGPIALLVDKDKDGTFEDKRVIAPGMNNCQGLSFIRGKLYAVGDGPKGTGVYRLADRDGDGVFEDVTLIRGAEGGMGEHGPHSVQLGPDGCLYYNNGNHAHLKPPIDPKSPVNAAFRYEGELLPHYNDARGHAAGIMAPGGEIYRSADDGQTWERVVAGFRNEYDFAFNRDGELFTFDSDMEWDIGLPWYRPVRVNHCVPGAEFGWRNGSGKWPPYFFDSLPSTLDIGRGSPTGVAFYQGRGFPKDYDDNFLICDWSQGRILAIELTRAGATYNAKEKELVSGQPLNCTDIEVGPDGAVYFTTGGRGTLGGLYRVSHVDQEKREVQQPKGGKPDLLGDALGMDSPLSSFGQRRLAQIRQAMGDEWGKELVGVATNHKMPAELRIRALDLLTQLGPEPSEDLLLSLSKGTFSTVHAKAVSLLGARSSDRARAAIRAALDDPAPFTRRVACEALVRSKGPIPVEKLLPLLGDEDRWVRYAARVAIEHGDIAQNRDRILAAKATRPLLEGMLALVRASRLDAAAQDDLLAREARLLRTQQLTQDEELDLLRLIGLTYLLGPQKFADVTEPAGLRDVLLSTLPAPRLALGHAAAMFVAINREQARLLAFLGEPRAVSAILKAQRRTLDHATQIHYTYCLRNIKEGWTSADKEQLWAWYETASHWDGGFSFLGYLDFMAQNLVALLTPEERSVMLAQGEKYPFPTRVLVRALDLNARPERVNDLTALYARLDRASSPGTANELRGLILESLGRSDRPRAHAALRDLAERDRGRRDLIARALSYHPTADDLPVLVAALEARDPNTTSLVLNALGNVDRAPEGPEGLRNLVRLAQRTGPAILPSLNRLAAKWTGVAAPRGDFAAALARWEAVYAERFPKGPALYEAEPSGQNAYTLAQLAADVLQSGLVKKGSPERGKLVIAKAKCLDCHKLGDQGQGLGPDLTTVSSRFRPHEILESIVEPSKVISDQYQPVSVATADGKVYNGMPVAGDPATLVLLLSDGTKVTIPKADVDAQKPSKTSVMPEGLLDALSLQEIADLLALFEAQPRVEVPQTAPKR